MEAERGEQSTEGAGETRGLGERFGDQGGKFEDTKEVLGQKGGKFEEKTEIARRRKKDSCKGEKDEKKGRGGEVGVVREEYSNNLRNVIGENLGDNSKEWRQLNGCWYQMVDRAYEEYLG